MNLNIEIKTTVINEQTNEKLTVLKTAKDALAWLVLIKEELGNDWLVPELFRFGASSLLGDIERQLEHNLTGRYSASFRHPIA